MIPALTSEFYRSWGRWLSNTWDCEQRRRPQVSQVLSECVLLTWAQPCQGPKPQAHGKMAEPSWVRLKEMARPSLLVWVPVLIVCAENAHRSFLPERFTALRLLLWRLAESISLFSLRASFWCIGGSWELPTDFLVSPFDQQPLSFCSSLASGLSCESQSHYNQYSMKTQ